jgi:hypothetical protein
MFLVGIWILFAFGVVSLTIQIWLRLSGRQRGQAE